MSDERELRADVERLSAELRAAHAALEEVRSISGDAQRLRVLGRQVTAARAQRDALTAQLRAEAERLDDMKRQLQEARATLAETRRRIADHESLHGGSATRRDWQPAEPGNIGCLVVFGVLGVSLATGAAVWWS